MIGAIAWGTTTSVGTVRKSNEDAFGDVAPWLFGVADGMGTDNGGGAAAATAISAVMSLGPNPFPDWPTALLRINLQIKMAARSRGHESAGSTLLVASVVDGLVTIVNIGDSRAYLVSDDGLTQLTGDHTVEAELMREGIDPRSLGPKGKRSRDAVTRFLGGSDELAVPDVTSLTPRVGDRLLLLTDGVHRPLTDHAMYETATTLSAEECAASLVEQADKASGSDNATASVIAFGETNHEQ